MLLVKTRVLKSTIPGAGKGLFLDEDAIKGTVFARFNERVDLVIGSEELLHHPEMWKFAYYDEFLDKYVYCSDDARFINHSCENYNYITNENNENVFLRDMRRGEEILANYCIWNEVERELTRKMLGKTSCKCQALDGAKSL